MSFGLVTVGHSKTGRPAMGSASRPRSVSCPQEGRPLERSMEGRVPPVRAQMSSLGLARELPWLDANGGRRSVCPEPRRGRAGNEAKIFSHKFAAVTLGHSDCIMPSDREVCFDRTSRDGEGAKFPFDPKIDNRAVAGRAYGIRFQLSSPVGILSPRKAASRMLYHP
jgi:hypothetical protein